MNQTLIEACAILLGPHVRLAGESIVRQLDAATLKRAFRRMALSTHPDVARQHGVDLASFDSSRFLQSLWAYERLLAYLSSRNGSAWRKPAGPAGQAGARAAGPTVAQKSGEAFYRGPLPQRRLRFSEYLYYSGLISWRSLIASIVWQRRGRPKFGEIARDFRVLTLEELLHVLEAKTALEPTGAAASRLRLLSPQEVAAVLRHQRSLQKPIGRYFLERERMQGDELRSLVAQLYRHNARFGPRP